MRILIPILCLLCYSCADPVPGKEAGAGSPADTVARPSGPGLFVLGTVQDAGSPQAGCRKACCAGLFDHPQPDRMVVSLGLYDPVSDTRVLFEATPDYRRQSEMLNLRSGGKGPPDHIFLTHAHIGHYTGLMFLGRESMNADSVPVHAMPRMAAFLRENGPWSQLCTLGNIEVRPLLGDSAVQIASGIRVTPLLVPHRDEFSETVGYRIEGPSKTALFIPDIDKWDKWERDIVQEIEGVDYAFLDATFYDGAEIGHRDISEIPHPFVIESMERFGVLPPEEKAKLWFIHFNHTNPLLDPQSAESNKVRDAGYGIAQTGDWLPL